MIIDLTHRLHNGMPVYPGTPAPTIAPCNSIASDGFAELSLSISNHTGTHIDAPSHILSGARSLSDFSIDYFIGPALLIDVTNKELITIDDLQPYADTIAQVDFVVLRTGWQYHWSSASYLDGFAVLAADAAHWLAAQNLHAVGVDTISIDRVGDDALPNHHALLGTDTLIVENLTNLDRINSQLFELHCLPLNISDADGSPVRAYARTTDSE